MPRLLSLLVLLLPILTAPAAVLAADRPNVILIMTDDQGYGELSCHGNPVLKTPRLDQLAAESVRLTDFHVAPMCTPTRGQLMTGLDAFRNGATNVSSGRTLLRADLPTMADLFAADGYQTGIFGKWHLGDNYPFRPQDRGFQESIWFPSSHIPSVPDYWNNDYFDDVYFHNGQRKPFSGYCTDVFFDESMRWIRQCTEADQPFFLYLPLNAAHGPHFVPDHYRPPIAQALQAAESELPPLSKSQRTSLISYLAMIANIDENFGRLEDFLQQQNLRDNTVLIFLTDNGSTMGPMYYNAGMRGKKVTLWEGGHRVPCFLRWPAGDLRPAGEVDELTHVQDLLPTLVDLCQLQGRNTGPLDGVSLAGLLRGETDSLADRMLVVNYSRMPFANDRPVPDAASVPRRDGAAVLWKQWRLLEDKQLYDVDKDPAQTTDVIDQHPQVVAKMRAHLDRWWAGVQGQVNQVQRVIIGSEHENPSRLTACEWLDVFVDQQGQVRRGTRKNGVWHLQVAEAGEYQIELRRWPAEADVALSAGVPRLEVTDGAYPEGVALPIAAARLTVGDFDRTEATGPEDRAAVFRLSLSAGPTEMQTWFLDSDGQEICGAYYVNVRRLE